MSLVLQNLRSNQRIKLDEENPVIIGRGNVDGCFDKRVSRNHGKITCTLDGKIRLAALHCNPCFFTRNGVPPVVQLNKDEEETLTEGDCLGLLPNAFWFQIKTIKEEKPEISKDAIVVKIEKTEDDDAQPKDIVVPENVNPMPNTSETSSESTSISSTNSGSKSPKTLKQFGDPDFEKTKRLPLWMYEIDEPVQPNNISNKHKLPNDEEGDSKRPRVEPDTEENGSSSNTQMVGEVSATDTPSTSNMESNNELTLKTSNQPENTDQAAGGSSEVTIKKEGYESDVNDSQKNPQKRPICQYEGNCYRKNPQHKVEYSHPGDADFVLYEDRPVCQYGAACYRKNERHKVEFRHPAPNSRPNNISPSSSSQSSIASSPLPAKRRRKKVQKHSPKYGDEDEYDLEDPFINDATSDEYVPSISDSEEELEDLNTTHESD